MYTQRRYNAYMKQEKRYSVRFPESVLEAIQQAAQEDNRSVNGEIVWIVRTYLEERKGKRRRVTLQKDQA